MKIIKENFTALQPSENIFIIGQAFGGSGCHVRKWQPEPLKAQSVIKIFLLGWRAVNFSFVLGSLKEAMFENSLLTHVI